MGSDGRTVLVTHPPDSTRKSSKQKKASRDIRSVDIWEMISSLLDIHVTTSFSILAHCLLLVSDRSTVPPKFTKVPKGVFTASRSTVTLECAAFGVPAPIVRWTRSGVPLPAGRSNQQSGVLTITRLHLQDSGLYYCTATNKLGTIRTKATLVVRLGREYFNTSFVSNFVQPFFSLSLFCAKGCDWCPAIASRGKSDGVHEITGEEGIFTVRLNGRGFEACR